jgi:hypothetical protein
MFTTIYNKNVALFFLDHLKLTTQGFKLYLLKHNICDLKREFLNNRRISDGLLPVSSNHTLLLTSNIFKLRFFITRLYRYHTFPLKCKGKSKVHREDDTKTPEGQLRYSSTLSLTSALDGGW